jgi:hypothetical protein
MFSLEIPKWVAIAVAVAAAVLMVVGYAISDPAPLRTRATEAGLPTDFELVEAEGDFVAYFTEGGVVCMWEVFCMEVPPHIGVRTPADWPQEWKLAVLYHEIGHYQQHVAKLPMDEWDADLRSARQLCSMGLNGPELVAEVLASFTSQQGLQIESPRHGNHYRRIDNLRQYGCRNRGLGLLDVNQS